MTKREVEKILDEKIKENEEFGYTMPQTEAKRAYQYALSLVEQLEEKS